ncbi:MAG TPA: MG2 domain-containing protein, partial [Candidatus Limnocylindrales bacterium]|nr:MG2 domain-containing protein [Candidatus Limnocylindrales bacterium]
MRRPVLFLFLVFALLFPATHQAIPGEEPSVEMFSPEGPVKRVRQVAVRFSEQMVSFGDPRVTDPFDIDCSEKGKGRWADGRNWVYDFDEDLPAGLVCTFTLKPSLAALSGRPVGGQSSFTFSTGGPAILHSIPGEGTTWIAEDQAFVLLLDAEAVEASILDNVSFSVSGVAEAVGVSIVKGKDRKAILESGPARVLVTLIDKGRRTVSTLEFRRKKEVTDDPRVVVLKARRVFPPNADVRLVWGPGVRAKTGVATGEAQLLPFRTRLPFAAQFTCSRENKEADCIPMLPMEIRFSAPVSRKTAEKIRLKGPGKRAYAPVLQSESEESDSFVSRVLFQGPFPEKTSFTVVMPKGVKDDAGRPLANADKFPLRVATDSFPPLAKFSAPFGIIELSPEPLLPVTLRNLEAEVTTRMLDVDGAEGETSTGDRKEEDGTSAVGAGDGSTGRADTFEGVTGRVLEVPTARPDRIVQWLHRVEAAQRIRSWDDARDRRDESVLQGARGVREFKVPKPGGAKAFEVVGIPLRKAGFYIVEMESRILGTSLLGADKPMYVPAAALVTDLSAHFKWGRESSAVWVTSLSTGKPVAGARIAVNSPDGKLVWEGATDGKGIALIRKELPDPRFMGNWKCEPHCGYFVSARTENDMTFVFSGWDGGIEPFRFNLPGGGPSHDPAIAHTVFDRTLLRAGETVSMKHFFRRHAMQGISPVDQASLPKAVAIEHLGSDQRYEFPLSWRAGGSAETTWKIPQDAKLGEYRVTLLASETGAQKERKEVGRYRRGDERYWAMKRWPSGSFRVEEYRIPLMKGSVRAVGGPLVRAKEADLDLQLSYLAGGSAGGAPVTLRTAVRPRNVSFADYDDFTFANGGVREGARRSDTPHFYYGGDWEYAWEEGEEEGAQAEDRGAGRKPKVRSRDLLLDAAGALRTRVSDLPASGTPLDLVAEMEYSDPNGEVQTVSARVPLWPSKVLVGIRPDSWAASKESFKFHVRAADLSGRPVPDAAIGVDLFQRKQFTHRKRLVGGFYAYEHVTETKRLGAVCEGKTDPTGLLVCETVSPVSGNVIVVARARDGAGNESLAHRDVWVAGQDEWWFDVSDSDRIDLLPEKKRYEPGETAKLQVRMPFREATALVTVEREGIVDAFVTTLSGKAPVVELPVLPRYAPNVFVSVLCVRGRVAGVLPTATVDLARPAYKLGIAEFNVGWKAHELKVAVSPGREVYKVREKARVRVAVRRTAGGTLPPGSEVAVAAVDEGLLELSPNGSWELLRG